MKWEYKIVRKEPKFKFPVFPSARDKYWEKTLNELGSKGWELIDWGRDDGERDGSSVIYNFWFRVKRQVR